LIRRSPQEFEDATRDLAEGVRKDIRSNWSATAPSSPGQPPAVRSGTLDKSIAVFKRRSGKLAIFVLAALAEWAGWLEFGTRKMRPRPFMRPAMKRAKNRLASVYKAAIERVLRS
jgi:HK97 gp10 family phage protein